MDPIRHNLTFMLRNSGDVLKDLNDQDVILERRDGPDLFLATAERESEMREGFDVTARVTYHMLSNPALEEDGLASLRSTLPWVEWLTPADQHLFVREFGQTVAAASATGMFHPLKQLLNSWQKSALIQHDPYLLAALTEDRGPDAPTPVRRPETES
ncbi:MAG: DUF6247 family protein [Actinomycetes bacterium]